MENNSTNDWLIEQEHVAQIKIEEPELLEPEKWLDEDMFTQFGISIPTEDKFVGAIKALPCDFIVEEITMEGQTMSVTDITTTPDLIQRDMTKSLFFKIVKTKVSTLEAINRITEFAHCQKEKISYAGIKDAAAITGQAACTKEIPFETLKHFSDPNVIITDIRELPGGLSIGSLNGNRFSIFVRGDFSGVTQGILDEKIAIISEKGIPNFYGTQRFGAPRFLSHVFGKTILQGNYKKLFEMYLFEESVYEYRLITKIRRKLKQLYGDWDAMLDISAIMPHAFRIERHFIREAKKRGARIDAMPYKDILCTEKDQMRIWVYAYASFLANKVLSASNETSETTLPLLITRDEKARELYDYFLTVDGTDNYRKELLGLPFIYLAKENTITRNIKPIFLHSHVAPDGISLQFELPKGVYATILLQHLFAIKPYTSINSNPAEFVDVLSRLDGRQIPDEVKNKL
ncbi:MAG: tRNA pseudouridine synthase TruD, tRNA pseudouridsynthase [Candidatus Parcubacteria bacterium]|jgi:TruD family tRNA pseudouridine synthase